MNLYCMTLLTLCLFYIRETSSLFDPLSISAAIGAGTGIYYGFKYASCQLQECCNENYIPQNMSQLQEQLKFKVFGQKLAIDSIVSSLYAQAKLDPPKKALTLAFHGSAGTGKNYAAGIIRDAFYKKGVESKYFHFYNGRSDFPSDRKTQIDIYQERLRNNIIDALDDCPKSMFVFDEIDDMAEGVLNALVPFLEPGPTQVMINSKNKFVETRYAIFIFLCNAGSSKIVDKSIEMWLLGFWNRDKLSLSDFEIPISIGAFNDRGGFHKSDTISKHSIDHYIPFLPLETQHVIQCIETAFRSYGKEAKYEDIKEVKSYVTFGPEPYNIFATSGCKRLEQKVASAVYRRKN